MAPVAGQQLWKGQGEVVMNAFAMRPPTFLRHETIEGVDMECPVNES